MKLKDACPWKNSSDKPRNYIKKQRQYFANKGLYNQSYWFSDTNVHIWEFRSVQLLSRVRLLQPYGLQHARLSCPSPTPGACSNSCPLSRWCHLTISSSVIPFSSCLQSFPAPGFFSQWVSSLHQVKKSTGVSASASLLPMDIQDRFHLLAFQGTLKSLL